MPEAWAFHQTNFSERQVGWVATSDALSVKVKRAFVESGVARLLPPHPRAEKLLEHFLLESANNWIFIQHVLERRVAFQYLRAAIVGHELRHVTLRIANLRQRLVPLRQRCAFHLRPPAS